MDARRFISSIYSSQHVHPVTQIVMNLPNDAAEFLGGYFQIPFVSCQLESSNFNWFFSLFS
jgi:hypothetical protein